MMTKNLLVLSVILLTSNSVNAQRAEPSYYHLAIAQELIEAPVGTPIHYPYEDNWIEISQAVQKVAIEAEILDSKEIIYIAASLGDFQGDLDILRKRHENLKDTPFIKEADRFPDINTVDKFMAFNRRYQERLNQRLVWEKDRADIITKALNESQNLLDIWYNIREAKNKFNYIYGRRLALQSAKNALSKEMYENGEMPPYVPDWRFPHMPK